MKYRVDLKSLKTEIERKGFQSVEELSERSRINKRKTKQGRTKYIRKPCGTMRNTWGTSQKKDLKNLDVSTYIWYSSQANGRA